MGLAPSVEIHVSVPNGPKIEPGSFQCMYFLSVFLKCVFGCPDKIPSPILRPPGTPFWPIVAIQGPISFTCDIFLIFCFSSFKELKKPEKMSMGSGGFPPGTRAPEFKIGHGASETPWAAQAQVPWGPKNDLGFFADM